MAIDKDSKEKLVQDLYKITENNESTAKKVLQELGHDTDKIKIIDKSKYMVEFIPDTMEEMKEKYGEDVSFNDLEIDKEFREILEKKLQESLSKPKKWNVLYLLHHCKIPREIDLGENIQLIPFGEWSCDDYINIIDRLTSSRGVPISDSTKDLLEESKKRIISTFGQLNPLALLKFSNINAGSQDEAYDKTRLHATNITTILSVLTNASIEIKAWMFEGIFGNGLKNINPGVFFWKYEPVFLDPDTLEKTSTIILDKFNNNYLLQLALKYENDAIMEIEDKHRMLKRWSVLEYIAHDYSKSISKELLSKKDISKIVDFILKDVICDDSKKIKQKVQNSVSDMNRKNAKDKVRDLLIWCKYPIKEIGNDKDILDIIYQNRNCITHAGGCYKYDNTKEKCKTSTYCRNSDLDMFELNRELSRMLKSFIGRCVGIEFGYRPEVPESIKQSYE